MHIIYIYILYICMYILTTWECKLIPVAYVCLTAQFWHLFLLLLLSRAAYANHFRRFQGTPKRIETFNLFASLWLLVPILQGLRFELNIPTWMLFELNTSLRLSQGYSHRSLSKKNMKWIILKLQISPGILTFFFPEISGTAVFDHGVFDVVCPSQISWLRKPGYWLGGRGSLGEGTREDL
jgi:hypothetical protein